MRPYFLFFLAFIFMSCEYEAQLSYKIKNNTPSTIKVVRTNTESIIVTDTFLINTNDQVTIAVNGQGLNRVSSYKEKDEKLRDFSKMDIFKNDTIQSTTDFLKTERWIYDEIDHHIADYILTVLPTDF